MAEMRIKSRDRCRFVGRIGHIGTDADSFYDHEIRSIQFQCGNSIKQKHFAAYSHHLATVTV